MIEVKITPDAFAAKAAQLKREQGIDLSGNSGTIDKDGVKAQYSYDGTTLSITVLHKPFFVSSEHVADALAEWLNTPALPVS